MKTKIFSLLLLAVPLLLTSCLNDDSTGATVDVSDIEVKGLQENYECKAFVGENLQITPEINTGYSADQLEYTWLLLSSTTGSKMSDNTYEEPVVISSERNLDYPVQIAAGSYEIRLVVKSKTNNYTVVKSANLNVTTSFSHGFYIMKETADGNTDLDLLTTDGTLGQDLLASLHGGALVGKPYALSIDYNHFYVNDDTEKMEGTHLISVVTEDGNTNVLRASDLKVIFDRSNLEYEQMPASEKPGILARNAMYSLYFSSEGVYHIWAKSMYTDYGLVPANSGRFGYPDNETVGASKYAFVDPGSFGGFYFWDDRNKSIMAIDMNVQQISPLLKQDGSGRELTQNLTGYECLACGMNNVNSTATGVFILKDASSGQRYLYTTYSTFGVQALVDRVALNPSSHMASATSYSINGMTARYIYCVSDGKLYGCNLNSADYSEVAINPEGIGSDETVTYVSNCYWNSTYGDSRSNFNYFVVGTQKGTDYHLYMYNMVGGLPDGAPVISASGTGSLKAVRFLFGSGYFSENDYYGSFYPNGD